MTKSLVNYDYKGSQISFQKGEGVMINATEMAKPFGKSPKDFLKTEQTKRFLAELSEVKKILSPDLVRVTYGDRGGTWMQEDVALEFARWLSPAFAIWCNDRIKELLQSGQTSIKELSRKQLAQMVIEAEEEKERLMLENQSKQLTIELQQAEIDKAAPKIEYFDNALQSVNTFTFTQVAKSIGMTAQALLKKLETIGFIFNQSSQWQIKSPYDKEHLHAERTQTFTRNDGSQGSKTYTVLSARGKFFVRTLSECGWSLTKAIKILNQLSPAV